MLGKLDNEQSFKLAEACFQWRWAAEGAPDSAEEATYERSETKHFCTIGAKSSITLAPICAVQNVQF